jgi:hypothetical protein
MAGEEQPQTTLRDTIAQQVDALEQQSNEPTPAPEPAASEPAAAAPASPSDDRPRDEHGRFLPAGEKKTAEPQAQAVPAPVTAPVTPGRAPLARPSAWKKDYWGHWDKLTKGDALSPEEAYALAQYNLQREGEYAKGVSTYKAELDRLKPIEQAIADFAPLLQAHKIEPAQWISGLGNAHRTLALGTPDQKLSMFLKLANDYQVPVQNLFSRGQDGQMYFNPQVQPYQPPQQQTTQPDVRQTVQEILSQEKAQQALAAFEQDATTKYQHYEAVRGTMAQLLDAGFSKTLEEAYDTSLRLPQHADLYAQVQQAKADQEKAEAAKKAADEAARARRNNISPRSSTPASAGRGDKPRSIRDHIESAIETHGLDGSARV